MNHRLEGVDTTGIQEDLLENIELEELIQADEPMKSY
jgi:hypothetical protein